MKTMQTNYTIHEVIAIVDDIKWKLELEIKRLNSMIDQLDTENRQLKLRLKFKNHKN